MSDSVVKCTCRNIIAVIKADGSLIFKRHGREVIAKSRGAVEYRITCEKCGAKTFLLFERKGYRKWQKETLSMPSAGQEK